MWNVTGTRRDATAELDPLMLADLEAHLGDAFYVLDTRKFKENYDALLGAFRKRYRNTRIAYSYKTNYTPALCRLIDTWGGYAEVVSALEYDLAVRLGVDGRSIIFNGPYKTDADIATAAASGSIVNVDWPYQIEAVERLARGWKCAPMRVGIRVTFAIAGVSPSRFGFDADGPDLVRVLERLRALEAVKIEGLHCHFLTPARSIEDYRHIATRMTDLAVELFSSTARPSFIDVGGGFFSRMPAELAAQFKTSVPSFDDYAEAIAGTFSARYGGDGPTELVIEPGLALTADAAQFVTKVVDVRELKDRKLALASGSFYDIRPTGATRNLPLRVVRCGSGMDSVEGEIEVVGNTCMEHDVMHRGYVGRLHVGDYLVFSNVGSYTNVLRPPFIRGCRPIVAIREDRRGFEIVRRADDAEQVFSAYI